MGARVSAGKTSKLIVFYPAGGTTDLLGRMIVEELKTGLSAMVIVENRPGGTTLGAEQVAKAEPDGTTLLIATLSTLAINTTLYRKPPFCSPHQKRGQSLGRHRQEIRRHAGMNA